MSSAGSVTIGLIGFGTLAKQVVSAFGGQAIRWVVLLRSGSATKPPPSMKTVTQLGHLIDERPDIVVETAGQPSVAAYVPDLLRAGIPVVVASIGALADEGLAHEIAEARRASGARLVVPSGAIGGLDYLAAVARLPGTSVRYRLRKPFAAWRSELAELGLLEADEPVVLFEGSPAEAARRYPKNTNAAFTAALAVRPAELSVSVVADPALTGNVHEIEVISAAGKASFRFANTPSPDNPKTSIVTGFSLAAAARDLLEDGGKL